MKKQLSVLIIEDHPLTSLSYKSAFECVSAENNELKFNIEIVIDCDSAIKEIKKAKKGKGLDIVFLDISIKPSNDGKFLSGEDLGIEIKKVLPKTKIMVSTTHYDNFRIQAIIKSVNPDAFLVKNDLSPSTLINAINKVIVAPPYYTHTVLQSFRKLLSSNHIIDEIDRHLLYELSMGTKMKELPKLLPMSMAGIEKRKRQLKGLFDIEDKEDRELVILAKEKGFI